MTRATLNDLVENLLRKQLEYGEEFSINTEQGTIYDPDLDDNLPKKLSDLGVEYSSFVTVIDEDDQPRVNLQLVVVPVEKTSSEESSAKEQTVVLDKVHEIPRKPKAPTPAPEADQVNGTLGKRKRGPEEAELNGDPPTKRVAEVSISDGVDKAHPINKRQSMLSPCVRGVW